MIRLTVDPAFQDQLQQAGGRVELCDGAGNLLGIFLPAKLSDWEAIDWMNA